MAGKGGGAWKVAYADFVTAMMAFFLVMWITAQSKEVKESVARYFEDPMGTSDTSRLTATEGLEGASAMGTFPNGGLHTRGLAEADPNSTPKMGAKSLKSYRPERLKIFSKQHTSESRGTMILFKEDSAEMTESGIAQLSTIIPAFLGKPNKIEVRGHASRKPLPPGSKFRDAWELSYARCVATMRGLIEGGIERERIRLSQDASFEPYTGRLEGEWQELNSRVEVFAINEFAYDFKSVREAPGGFFGEPAKTDAKTESKDEHPAH
jgi:chemotaxis protein MotB